jgi:NAD(P)-dependent dehydrogenase (short-subunit alcohol dehydrogenase family)
LPEGFKDILEIHLVGNLRLANRFRPHLKASKGCLINIGSMYSYFGAAGVPAVRRSKKHRMVSLTKSLAISFAEDGIRVNASTRLLRNHMDDGRISRAKHITGMSETVD